MIKGHVDAEESSRSVALRQPRFFPPLRSSYFRSNNACRSRSQSLLTVQCQRAVVTTTILATNTHVAKAKIPRRSFGKIDFNVVTEMQLNVVVEMLQCDHIPDTCFVCVTIRRRHPDLVTLSSYYQLV